MYKTACIRERLPRLYVEMALLECYRFIYDADFAAILMRLAHAVRGLGNPVVAAYARLYLARMAAKLVRDDNRQRDSVMACVADFFATFGDITSGAREASLAATGVSMPVYLQLFQPALAWQMHQLAWGATKDTFQSIMAMYREQCGNSMVLQLIMEAFDPFYYSTHVTGLVALIGSAKPSLVSPAEVYRTLASQLVKQPPPAEQRMGFLNEAYKAMTRVADPVAYVRAAAGLMELLLAAYTEREVLLLMGDVVRRMQASATASGGDGGSGGGGEGRRGRGGGGGGTLMAPAAALPHLERILTSAVELEVTRANKVSSSSAARFSSVLTSEHFTALLDMFDAEHKPALCKALLSSLTSVPGNVMDPIVVNTCVLGCRGRGAHAT